MVVDNKLEVEKKYASPGHGGTAERIQGFYRYLGSHHLATYLSYTRCHKFFRAPHASSLII
jgi:hypothetical protein